MAEKKPFEIARDALKQLAARRLIPTPANYQAVYNEIAGVADLPPFPEQPLRDIAQALPVKTAAQRR